MPNRQRRSAKSWYAEGCGVGGHIAAVRTHGITAAPRREFRAVNSRRIPEIIVAFVNLVTFVVNERSARQVVIRSSLINQVPAQDDFLVGAAQERRVEDEIDPDGQSNG